METGLETNC